MTIKRDFYVDKLMSVRHNGLVKVITGVRRCGKSYLLFNLYRDSLKAEGVEDGGLAEVEGGTLPNQQTHPSQMRTGGCVLL